MQPLTNPASKPVASAMRIPVTIWTGVPLTTFEATQLVNVIIAPTDKSMPPVSTGTVCAIATRINAKDSLEFWTNTSTVQPFGCSEL